MSGELDEAERLAIAYAPAGQRRAWRAVMGLDAALSRAALSAREPLPAQLRLAWWRDACARLPDARETPVLADLAANWRGTSTVLIDLVDAWEELAVAQVGAFGPAAEAVARQRAHALASCVARHEMKVAALSTGQEDAILNAARMWTLVTLAAHAPDPAEGADMRAHAGAIAPRRLPREMRPLAVLSGLAHRALAAGHATLVGDRLSGPAAMRLGIFGR